MAENVGFCKMCLKKIDKDDINEVKDVMRMMNTAFVEDSWERALDSDASNPITKYLQLIATRKDGNTYSDSVENRDIDSSGITLTKNELIAKWGFQKDDNKYIELEASYNNLTSIKPPSTTLDQKRYAQNVMLEQQLNEALLQKADYKEISALKKLYETNIKELGLDIDAKAKDDVISLGERVRNWELNAPVPQEEVYEDVDKLEYFGKWFVIQMKRVFGKASEEEIRSLYEE